MGIIVDSSFCMIVSCDDRMNHVAVVGMDRCFLMHFFPVI